MNKVMCFLAVGYGQNLRNRTTWDGKADIKATTGREVKNNEKVIYQSAHEGQDRRGNSCSKRKSN